MLTNPKNKQQNNIRQKKNNLTGYRLPNYFSTIDPDKLLSLSLKIIEIHKDCSMLNVKSLCRALL